MESTAVESAPEKQEQVNEEPLVLNEVKECEANGKFIGQCKWFSDRLGFGFITVCNGEEKGKDIFVHHSGIRPQNSNYNTLRKGEYIQFNVINGVKGLQAVDIRGVGGGPLMCDFVTTRKPPGIVPRVSRYENVPPPPPPSSSSKPPQWQHVGGNKTTKYTKTYANRVATVQPVSVSKPPFPQEE